VLERKDLHKCNADEAECAPDEEDFALEVGALLVDHVRCSVRDCPVKQPVACEDVSGCRVGLRR
jgi:hypothetical protein